MIDCVCANASESKIRQIIKDNPEDPMKALNDLFIGLGCRMCCPYLEEYIKEELGID